MVARAGSATLVTALVDVGRGRLAGPFARSFQQDDLLQLTRLAGAVSAPMVIYLDPRYADLIWRIRRPANTRLVPLCAGDLDALPYYRRFQKLRTRAARKSSGWTAESPLLRLPRHGPLALARPRWLAKQAQANPFGTEHVFWVDPGLTRTLGAERLRGRTLGARLSLAAAGRFLLPYVLGPDGRAARSPVFGGRPEAVATVAERYEALMDEALLDGALLDEALSAGGLPTDQSILTAMLRRWPELFTPRQLGRDGFLGAFLDRLPAARRRRDTLVTAVYELDPAAPWGGRGRPFGFYLPSLASVAQMGAGLVVYTHPGSVARVTEHLAGLGAPAEVIGRELDSAPRYEQIQEIRVRQEFHTKPWRDRCHVLCHAKLAWLAEQAEANPFGSHRLYWIDAGLAHPGLMPRRYLDDYFRDRCSLFSPGILRSLAALDRPLVLLGQRPVEGQRLHDIPFEEHAAWIGRAPCPIETHVVGGLFGGRRAAVRALYRDSDQVLASMLAADRLGTEENVLTVLYHRDPDRFTLLSFTTWHHEDSTVRRPGPGDVPFYRLFEALAQQLPRALT